MRQSLRPPRAEYRVPFGRGRRGGDQDAPVAVGSVQQRAIDVVVPRLELAGSEECERGRAHERTSAIAFANAGTARSHMSSFAVTESLNQPGISNTEPGST